jgi:hypothetical protein
MYRFTSNFHIYDTINIHGSGIVKRDILAIFCHTSMNIES